MSWITQNRLYLERSVKLATAISLEAENVKIFFCSWYRYQYRQGAKPYNAETKYNKLCYIKYTDSKPDFIVGHERFHAT